MSELWLIPALPLLGAVLTAAFGPRLLKEQSHWPCLVTAAVSAVLAFLVFGEVYGSPDKPIVNFEHTWFAAGGVTVSTALRADPLTAVMLVMITFIGALIAVFSVGYMHGDPGYPRFFALISLFLFCMTGLVLADNLVLLYAGWEGVGLCSYLLVGYYYAKPEAAEAARKAFLVTRLGDAGMLLGIFLLWAGLGHHLDYASVFAAAEHADSGFLTVACLLLFLGCVGKSAQFPLHVWLPDAMEGPTPVSALIHAATMVTAGVYLVARCTPLFVLAPAAQLTVACVGAFSALIAALIALTQHDLKRVLAYSTVSQLGYMFLALGCARPDLAWFAVAAALFHLFTHAFFKALLFLSAGSVMHAMGGVIDMRRFGGLRKVLPVTHLTFLAGALALSGLFPFSGFWSKDMVLEAPLMAAHRAVQLSWLYNLLFGVGLVTAALTAFYTFRAYFLTFHGPETVPHEAHGHAHESPAVMTLPLIILAVGAVGLGIAIEPFNHLLSHFLDHTHGLEPHGEEAGHGFNITMALASTVAALAGIGGAYLLYGKPQRPAEPAAGPLATLYQASLNRLYIDWAYEHGLVKPLNTVGAVCGRFVDGLIDAGALAVARSPALLAGLLRPIQNGLVQFYALAMMLGLTVFLGFLALQAMR
jgi:proton-translocating NADH-quinone oxidoreductase chain L